MSNSPSHLHFALVRTPVCPPPFSRSSSEAVEDSASRTRRLLTHRHKDHASPYTKTLEVPELVPGDVWEEKAGSESSVLGAQPFSDLDGTLLYPVGTIFSLYTTIYAEGNVQMTLLVCWCRQTIL